MTLLQERLAGPYEYAVASPFRDHEIRTALDRGAFLLRTQGIGQFDREQAERLERLKLGRELRRGGELRGGTK